MFHATEVTEMFHATEVFHATGGSVSRFHATGATTLLEHFTLSVVVLSFVDRERGSAFFMCEESRPFGYTKMPGLP